MLIDGFFVNVIKIVVNNFILKYVVIIEEINCGNLV